MGGGAFPVLRAGFIVLSLVADLSADDATDAIVSPGVIFETLALSGDLEVPEKPKYRSPVDLVPSPDGRYIYICQQTAKRIAVFDLDAKAVARHILLPSEVTGCAIAPDGKTLYATISSDLWPAGWVCVVDVAGGKVGSRIPAGCGARAPVITPDGGTLCVCNRFDNTVSLIDLATERQITPLAAVREPFCAAITPDGKTLLVGNFLPADRSTDTAVIASQITIIDIPAAAVRANIRLRRGSASVSGIAVSPDGKFAFATHVIGAFSNIGSTVEKGWLHTNNVAVIDVTSAKLVNEVCLDRELEGAGNPWGVQCSGDGELLVVAHAGSNELSVFRLPQLIDTVIARTAAGVDLDRDFSMMPQLGRRIPVTTRGPRSLAIMGRHAFTAGYFDDVAATMEEHDLTSDSASPVIVHQIGEPRFPEGGRIGECLFHDATLCFQKWQSCASCHPAAREDGLHWILGGGAIVAPKNTKSLVYSWWTAPSTWQRNSLHTHNSVIAMIELELFRVPTMELSAPIDTFLMRLKPVPSPVLLRGRLGDQATHGRAVFDDPARGNCRKCHPQPMFTDGRTHQAGVPDLYDAAFDFHTPLLIEAWRTVPYSHLGVIGTIREMVTLPGHGSAATDLSPDEIDDIVKFVQSL